MFHRSGRRIWIAGATILFLVAGLYFGHSFTKLFLNVPPLDGSTTTVIPGVHLIGSIGPAAAYVIETSDGLVLIDAGLDDDAGPLKAQMSKLAVDWKRLRAIFLTHVHGDHCGGAERLRAETGARIYAGQGDASVIAAGGPREAFFSTFAMPNHSPHPTHVDVSLQGEESIAIGNATFKILDTPGHTTGSVCYLMEKEGMRVLFSGDVIYRLGDKPLGTYSAYMAPRYRGDAREYLSSLKKLRSLPVPDLVLPGHPSASRGAHSPRFSQQDWGAMLERGIREMSLLIARFDSDGANFLDGEPKKLLPNLYYFGDFKGTAIYSVSSGHEFAVFDAPGGAGLNEFLKEKRKELGLPPANVTAILLTGCSEQETAGLNDLVEQTHARVFVAEAGIELVRERCPTRTEILAVNDLDYLEPFSVKALILGKPGTTLVAYGYHSANKTALISGKIPSGGDQRTIEDLLSPSGKPAFTPSELLGVTRKLLSLHSDMWLPAKPMNSPNANLYERDWQSILEKDWKAVNQFMSPKNMP